MLCIVAEHAKRFYVHDNETAYTLRHRIPTKKTLNVHSMNRFFHRKAAVFVVDKLLKKQKTDDHRADEYREYPHCKLLSCAVKRHVMKKSSNAKGAATARY